MKSPPKIKLPDAPGVEAMAHAKLAKDAAELLDRIKNKPEMATISGVIDGLRLYRVPTWLRNQAFLLGLKIERFEVDTGWLRETVRFSLNGTPRNIAAFKVNLARAQRRDDDDE